MLVKRDGRAVLMQPKCNPTGGGVLDEALALHDVREFVARAQLADGMWDPNGYYLNNPAYKQLGDEIHRTNAYQGSQNLGLACAKLVRNLATHNGTAKRDENEMLEELATLSRFARVIDSSTI